MVIASCLYKNENPGSASAPKWCFFIIFLEVVLPICFLLICPLIMLFILVHFWLQKFLPKEKCWLFNARYSYELYNLFSSLVWHLCNIFSLSYCPQLDFPRKAIAIILRLFADIFAFACYEANMPMANDQNESLTLNFLCVDEIVRQRS